MIDLSSYRAIIGSFNVNVKCRHPTNPPLHTMSSSPTSWALSTYILVLLNLTLLLWALPYLPATASLSLAYMPALKSMSDYSQHPFYPNLNSLTPALKPMSNYSWPPYYPSVNSLTPALKPMSGYFRSPKYRHLHSITPALKPLSDYSLPPFYPNVNSLTPALKPMSHFSRLQQAVLKPDPTTPAFLPTQKIKNKITHTLNGNQSEKGVKLAHWNAGGKHMENKMPEIECLVKRLHPAVLGISESNLKHTHDMSKVQLPGYELLTSKTLQNPELNISRVVVYVKDDLNCKLRPDLMDDKFSSIWVEVRSGKQKFLVANIYRDHQYMNQGADQTSLSMDQQLVRWVLFLEQWQRALATGLEVHTLGDYNLCSMNLHKINGEKQCLVDELTRRILPEGVTQCVRGPTRFPQGAQQHAPAGLDHFWSSAPEKLSEVQVLVQGSSDHSVIYSVRLTGSGTDEKKSVRKRDYSKFSEEKFLSAVQAVNWMCVYSCDNVDEATECLSNKLNSILDRADMAPVKVFQPRKHFAPWLSDDTKTLMTQRDSAQVRYNSSLRAEDWEPYRLLRNKVTMKLKNEKIMWSKANIERSEGEKDGRRIWKNVLGWLGWGKSTGGPSKLVDPLTKQLETSTQKLADIMNQFYITKVKQIRAMLPNIGDPLQILRRLTEGKTAKFSFSAVHPNEINRMILSLKNTKTCGVDMLDTYIIKLARPFIVPAVTHIVNASLTTLVFPQSWKISKTVPLYKGSGERTSPSSWRPVSLLPVLSKCLERCVHNQIVSYMDSNKFFHPSQHAYRTHHSTTTALLTMYDSWVDAADKGKTVGVALCDMSAAFDVVDTELLLKTCKQFGFEREAVQWIWSFLTDRSQAVHIGGSVSTTLPLEVGLPQGSILGPLLYSIFTCAFPEVIHNQNCPQRRENAAESATNVKFTTECDECGNITCFADDSSYSAAAETPDDLSGKLTHNFGVISSALTEQRLKINETKTHLLVMSTRQKRRHNNLKGVHITTPSV